jgi:beta-galactosidase/beta-glucuronidase
MGEARAENAAGEVKLAIALEEIHLWEPGIGRLYDLELTFGEDRVHSYFGLRSLRLEGDKFLINGKSVFQRLVLDQGFYPDGIYTAPTDGALERDIDMSMELGFNGARLHEKVFEERFLYHCDRKGYLVWGEYPNWGLDHSDPKAIYSILPEWLEELERD